MQKVLSSQVHNALTELGNIGAGNATTSLSVLLSSSLAITPPHVELYEFNDLENLFGGAETTTVGVMSSIEGDINAMFLFLMREDDAKQLVQVLLHDEGELSEYGMDAVKEIGNIMIGSYIASLESLSGIKIRYSVPQVTIDMAGAILSVPCAAFGQLEDKVLLINSGFKSGTHNINGYIMMVSEMDSYDVLLNRLGIENAYE